MRNVPLFDSLYNLVSGLGTSKDPTTAAYWQLNLLSRNDVENAYRSDWVSRKIIDAPSDDATREWRQWNASREQIKALESQEKMHDMKRKTRGAIIRARLYGGAGLVFAVKNQDPAEELDLEAVGSGDLEFVVVLNRYELMAGPRIFDVESPYYTRPEYYTVSTPMYGFEGRQGMSPIGGDRARQRIGAGQARIHPSRVVEFVGNELPDWRLIPMGGGWGDSCLQTLDDVLKDIGLVVGGVATMVNDAKVDVVKIPDFSKQMATDEYKNRLLARFAYANQAKSTVNSILLDTEEEWERINTSFAGVPNLLHEYLILAAGASEIPVSRFLGQAAGRGLGHGQGTTTGAGAASAEERAYYDRITSKQKNTYSPAMAPLDECIVRSALGRLDDNIYYDWRPLYQLDEMTKAKIAESKATTTKHDVEMGLINEDALRQARVNTLIEDGTYSGLEDAIDEFGSEPEEADVQVPWSRLAGQLIALGGGGMPKPNGGGNGAMPNGGAGNGNGNGNGNKPTFNPPNMRITRE